MTNDSPVLAPIITPQEMQQDTGENSASFDDHTGANDGEEDSAQKRQPRR
jgi:hypothetical protein